jgi:GNAT superfamily N-acetyltransferase
MIARMAVDVSARTTEIEEAFVGHWSHFGRWPHGQLVEEAGTLRFETPIPQLPYNAVIRTRIEANPGRVVRRVVESFRRRSVGFVWVNHPSAAPANLGELLVAEGVPAVEDAMGMSRELDGLEPLRVRDDVQYREVVDDQTMADYTDLIFSYWEVPTESRQLVAEVNRYWVPKRTPLQRWIAYDTEARPIGKMLLSFSAPPGVAAIYGMSVRPEARGRGVASDLTNLALHRAREQGCARVVLHASEMALSVYRRAGFTPQCQFTIHGTAPLWTKRDA